MKSSIIYEHKKINIEELANYYSYNLNLFGILLINFIMNTFLNIIIKDMTESKICMNLELKKKSM